MAAPPPTPVYDTCGRCGWEFLPPPTMHDGKLIPSTCMSCIALRPATHTCRMCKTKFPAPKPYSYLCSFCDEIVSDCKAGLSDTIRRKLDNRTFTSDIGFCLELIRVIIATDNPNLMCMYRSWVGCQLTCYSGFKPWVSIVYGHINPLCFQYLYNFVSTAKDTGKLAVASDLINSTLNAYDSVYDPEETGFESMEIFSDKIVQAEIEKFKQERDVLFPKLVTKHVTTLVLPQNDPKSTDLPVSRSFAHHKLFDPNMLNLIKQYIV